MLPKMQWSENFEFLKCMAKLKNDLGSRTTDPEDIAKEICKRYCIKDEAVEDLLSGVFSKLSDFEGRKTRSNKEFLDKFVSLMNQYFGKPKVEIWREFTLLDENGKMKIE